MSGLNDWRMQEFRRNNLRGAVDQPDLVLASTDSAQPAADKTDAIFLSDNEENINGSSTPVVRNGRPIRATRKRKVITADSGSDDEIKELPTTRQNKRLRPGYTQPVVLHSLWGHKNGTNPTAPPIICLDTSLSATEEDNHDRTKTETTPIGVIANGDERQPLVSSTMCSDELVANGNEANEDEDKILGSPHSADSPINVDDVKLLDSPPSSNQPAASILEAEQRSNSADKTDTEIFQKQKKTTRPVMAEGEKNTGETNTVLTNKPTKNTSEAVKLDSDSDLSLFELARSPIGSPKQTKDTAAAWTGPAVTPLSDSSLSPIRTSPPPNSPQRARTPLITSQRPSVRIMQPFESSESDEDIVVKNTDRRSRKGIYNKSLCHCH